MKRIEFNDNGIINFVHTHKEYGRAEFQICSKYKYGKLTELFIYPRQQDIFDRYYYWKGKAAGVSIGKFGEIEEPNIWHFHYCKEHKCQSMRVYVPNNSKLLMIDNLSTLGLYFK